MQKAEQLTLSTRLRPKTQKLMFLWIFVIIGPVITFSLIFDFILASGEEHLKSQTRLLMINEMDDFIEKLSTPVFLRHLLDKYIHEHNFGKVDETKISRFNQLNSDIVYQQLTNLGIKPFALFYHGPDTQNLSIKLSKNAEGSAGLVSRTMIQTLLMSLNNQTGKPRIFADKSGRTPRIDANSTNRANAYIRALFTANELFAISKNRITHGISGKPDIGKFYSIYVCAETTGPIAANAGGFILIVREKDIPINNVVDYAMSSRLSTGFVRTAETINFDDIGDFNRRMLAQPRFISSDEGLKLYSMPSDEIIVRHAQNDTFYPQNIAELITNFPVPVIFAPKSSFEHELRAIQPILNRAGLIFVIVTSLGLLRLFLFGYPSSFKISYKILISTIIAAMLPFSLFLTILIYYNYAYHELNRSETRQTVFLMGSQLSKATHAAKTYHEIQGTYLAKMLGTLDKDAIESYVKNWMQGQPILSVHLRQEGRDELLTNELARGRQNIELEGSKFLLDQLEGALAPAGHEAFANDTRLIKLSLKNLDVILTRTSSMHYSELGSLDSAYTVIPVFPDVNDKELQRRVAPSAILMVQYSTEEMLKRFLQDNPEYLTTEKNSGITIEKCFIPLADSLQLPETNKFMHTDNFNTGEIMAIADKVLKTKTNATAVEITPYGERIDFAIYDNNLQAIAVFRATIVLNSLTSVLPQPWQTVFYLAFLILLAFSLMNRYFSWPIGLFLQATDYIERGEYRIAIEPETGDEFMPLANAFNNMSRSLLEKEQMSNFVSDDIISEIESDSQLHPGGERIEATVIFCSLKDLKRKIQTLDKKQITSYLSILIDEADKCTRANGGAIDKLVEDTLMIVFRQNSASDFNHVMNACNTALALADRFPANDCPFSTAIGISSGQVVSGKIGSKSGKLNYTVIGNAANLAARLKAKAGSASNTGIIICPQTIRMLKGRAKVAFIERTEIKGRTRTFPLYELLKLRKSD